MCSIRESFFRESFLFLNTTPTALRALNKHTCRTGTVRLEGVRNFRKGQMLVLLSYEHQYP